MKPKKKKNKTAFCAFLLAALLPLSLKAQSVNLDLSYTASPLGVASQVAGAMYGLDSSLTYTATLRQIAVDAFGNIKTTGSGLTYTSATTVNANGFNFLSFTQQRPPPRPLPAPPRPPPGWHRGGQEVRLGELEGAQTAAGEGQLRPGLLQVLREGGDVGVQRLEAQPARDAALDAGARLGGFLHRDAADGLLQRVDHLAVGFGRAGIGSDERRLITAVHQHAVGADRGRHLGGVELTGLLLRDLQRQQREGL